MNFKYKTRIGSARTSARGVTMSRLSKWTGTALLFGVAGCSSFLEPKNPNLLDVNTVDPVNDATTLANSAQQSYASALGWAIMHGAWFTGEALVAETFPTRNEFGRRDVQSTNGSLSTDLWFPISQAASGSHLVLGLALPTPDTNINNVRAQTWLGYSFELMAEFFCEGSVYSGPRLTTQNMLDSAVANFTKAIASGTANATTAGVQLANVARVGRARAYLQMGKKAEAIADANLVPAGFSFNFNYVDDAGNRTRLNNRLWQFTSDRGSISVSPLYQTFADPRVKFKLPSQHNLSAQDANAGPFVIQDKYPTFNSPIRVASKLEADYIAAEAGSQADQLTLINARRTANGKPAYTGATTAAGVLAELMLQKAMDFFLEGQHMGDFRRNPAAVVGLPVAGSTYFKPGFAPIGSQSCIVLPVTETDNNPNFKK
ncbi:MAG: hypothetical protein ABI852_17020 [Gemmatimonadaceae bacterium]